MMESLLAIIQQLYNALHINHTATSGDIFGMMGVIVLIILSLTMIQTESEDRSQYDTSAQDKEEKTEETKQPTQSPLANQTSSKTTATELKETKTPNKEQPALAPKNEKSLSDIKTEIPEVKTPQKTSPGEDKLSWSTRLKNGLKRSRGEIWGKIENIVGSKKIDSNQLENIEELLYTSDLGPDLVTELIKELEENLKKGDYGITELKTFLYDFLYNKMSPSQKEIDHDLYKFNKDEKGKPKVIMIVGVNGAGKTTTIGKLATKLSSQGANVVVGACDTFRAAAVDQLQIWCDRAHSKMIRAKENADPSGVAYETLEYALKTKADYCLLDTAGRLHTKKNLMEELAKNKRVLQKLDETAPQHVLLVLDAITGQNALKQAHEFNNSLGLTGLIFTKCDGSSKAGSAVGIVQQLKVPISYIGVGESVEDLNKFSLEEYLSALLDIKQNQLRN